MADQEEEEYFVILLLLVNTKMKCNNCNGTSFTEDEGLKICNECGTVIDDYVELESQEIFSAVNVSRLSRVKKDKQVKVSEGPSKSILSAYEVLNIVLHEWTKALRCLGASADFEKVMLEVWVLYLQRSDIAFFYEESQEKDIKEINKVEVTTVINKSYRYTVNLPSGDRKNLSQDISKAAPSFDCFSKAKIRLELKENWIKVLLSLLYLGVLLSEEPIMLMDIVRWSNEGHIPVLSACNLTGEDFGQTVFSRGKLKNIVPSFSDIRNVTEGLVFFMNILKLPVPSMKYTIERLTKLLRLPEQVAPLAQDHLERLLEKQNCIPVIGMELYAMVAIIFVLKAFFGVNDVDEVYLSHAGRRLNRECGKKHKPFFIWEDWERYLNKLVWFCTEVHPVTRMQCLSREDFAKINSKIYSNYLWTEAIWNCKSKRESQHACEKKATQMAEKVLEAQNSSLDDVLNQPKSFKATKEPFYSIVEQFIEAHASDPSYAHQVKAILALQIGRDLLNTDFSSSSLFPTSISDLKKLLRENGSNIEIVDSPGKNTSESNQIYIPQPQKRFSRIYYKERTSGFNDIDIVAVNLKVETKSFQWLVTVCSFFCGTPTRTLLELLRLYESIYCNSCNS
ncbi:hypothetical protein SK128_003001 [Halocaridina rubra]|uniref:TATA box-binding protein-associated factor RNA polymerase I subunit B n=1 Tax=Halocaridina rubra TaxID=373956 RepID=A0AAN8W9P4_HALRR